MSYPSHDTEWATSAKGNFWKRIDGVVLIVGKSKHGKWWARRDDEFVPGSFDTKKEAMAAAEAAANQPAPSGDLDQFGG